MQPYYESLSVDLGPNSSLSFLDGSATIPTDGTSAINNVITSMQNNSSINQTQHPIATITNFEDNDVFQCGKCKQQFHNLQEFLHHKTNLCTNNHHVDQHHVVMNGPSISNQPNVVSLKNNPTMYHPTVQMVGNAGKQDTALNKTNASNGAITRMHLSAPSISQNEYVCIPSTESMNRLQELQPCQVVTPASYNQTQAEIVGSNEDCPQTHQMITNCQVEPNSQRILLSDILCHRSTDVLDDNSDQMDLLTNNEEIDDLSQGNGLITSLLQQIPPYDPIQKVPSDNSVVQTETMACSAGQPVPLSGNYLNDNNSVNNQSSDKGEAGLETLLGKLQSKSIEPDCSNNKESNTQGDKQTNVTDSSQRVVWVNNRRKFACRYCSKIFSKNFDMQQHERSHTGEKPFQCIVCGRAFAQKSNVKKHMTSHKVWLKSSSTFTQSFAKGDNPESTAVDESSTFTCQYCGKGFTSYYKRKTHMKEHKDQQVYKCLKEGCASTFQDLDQFIVHVNSHNSGMTYRCHECHKVFKSLQDLGVHQYQVHLNNKKKGAQTKYYACAMCPSKFTHPTALREHMSSDTHSYVCRVCDATFTCERYLRKHYFLQHKDQNSGGSVCGVCGKHLRSVYYLRLHMLIHTKELPYRCTKCDAAFNRKDKVKRHMLTHDPVKRFKCPLKSVLGCSKEFYRADKLKEHIITHSTFKKTYQCSYCNKKYRKHSCKVRHEKTHTSGKTCDQCERWYEDEKSLKSHHCKKIVKRRSTRTSTPSDSEKQKKNKAAVEMEEALETSSNQSGPSQTDLNLIRSEITEPNTTQSVG